MKMSFAAAGVFVLLLGMAACHKKGPAETAGQKLDNAGQSVHDAIDPPGPAEKAGRAVDNAISK